MSGSMGVPRSNMAPGSTQNAFAMGRGKQPNRYPPTGQATGLPEHNGGFNSQGTSPAMWTSQPGNAYSANTYNSVNSPQLGAQPAPRTSSISTEMYVQRLTEQKNTLERALQGKAYAAQVEMIKKVIIAYKQKNGDPNLLKIYTKMLAHRESMLQNEMQGRQHQPPQKIQQKDKPTDTLLVQGDIQQFDAKHPEANLGAPKVGAFNESQRKLLNKQVKAYQRIHKMDPLPWSEMKEFITNKPAYLKLLEYFKEDEGVTGSMPLQRVTEVDVMREKIFPISIPRKRAISESYTLHKTKEEDANKPSLFQGSQIRAKELFGNKKGFNVLPPSVACAVRNKLLASRMNFRMKELEANEKEWSMEAHMKWKLELLSMKLHERQRDLRYKVSQMVDSGGTLRLKTLRNDNLREQRRLAKMEAKYMKQQERAKRDVKLEWLHGIIDHGKKFYAFHRRVRGTMGKLVKEAKNLLIAKEKELERIKERKTKERMALLKANDEDGYRKLVEKEKNSRLQHLLDQTDSYLESMQEKIAQHQEVERNQEDGKKDSMEEFSLRVPRASVEEQTEHKSKFGTAHRIQEKVEQAAIMVNGKLKEYQVDGLEWMVSLYNNRLNGILADEMGLGKTIQSIALITYLMEKKEQMGPYLIIVPLTTMSNWVLEFEKWAPSVVYIPYKGNPSKRREFHAAIKSRTFNVLLTTYEFVLKDKSVLSKVKWTYMIIDEGHRLKNKDCRLTKALTQHYIAPRRLLLSGTPLQNNLPELWALLNFLLPEIFKSAENFDEWFSRPFANTGEKVDLTEEETMLVIQRLHKVLRPFLLRRLKKDVEQQLPDKVEHVIKCEMSALQKKLYHFMHKNGVILTPAVTTDEMHKAQAARGETRYLNNTAMQLKKLCNHPFMFSKVDEGFAQHLGFSSDALVTGPDLWRSAGKFELLRRILPKFKRSGHRVLMFCQMTGTMDLLTAFFDQQNYRYLRLDGTTKSDDRSVLIKQFNAEDTPYDLFVLSTRAGGLGLNLQSADTVIIFDSDWNPHQDLQAQDRAHRIGQKNEVRVLRFITVNSIEEVVLETAKYKLHLDDQVIQAGKFSAAANDKERTDYLRRLLSRELDDDTEEALPDASDLNQMLARSPEEFELSEKIDQELIEENKNTWMDEKRQTPLMQNHELPSWVMRTDAGVTLQENLKTQVDLTLGRGEWRRSKKNTNYAEWTDREFDKALRIGDPDKFAEFQAGHKRAREDSEVPVPAKKVKIVKDEHAELLENLSPSRLQKLISKILTALLTTDGPRGYKLCNFFMTDPTKDPSLVSYTDIVKKPMFFNKIQDKVNKEKYKRIQSFESDIKLIYKNALAYNSPSSDAVKDALGLLDVFTTSLDSELRKKKRKKEKKEERPSLALKIRLPGNSGVNSSVASPESSVAFSETEQNKNSHSLRSTPGFTNDTESVAESPTTTPISNKRRKSMQHSDDDDDDEDDNDDDGNESESDEQTSNEDEDGSSASESDEESS